MKTKSYLKRMRYCLMIVVLMIPLCLGGFTSNVSANSTSTEDEAQNAFQNSKPYTKVADDLVSTTPKTVKDSLDDDGNKTGLTLLYSVKSKASSNISQNGLSATASTQVTSPLVVEYDLKTKSVRSAVLYDYSSLMKNSQKITVSDLLTGKTAEVPVTSLMSQSKADAYAGELNNATKTTVEQVSEKVSTSNEKVSEDSSNNAVVPNISQTCQIYTCTAWQSGGGYYDGNCEALSGSICAFAGKVPGWVATVICAGQMAVGCYVSHYNVCVSGEWRGYNACPA